jgi:hypothetical protein
MQRLTVLFAALVVLTGCATNIKPTVTSNPAPARAFKEFEQFELKPLQLDAGVEEPAAVIKIREGLDRKINSLTATWAQPAGDTLVIEPRVRELKFVSGGQRFLVGAMAGSSAVRMTVKLTDKATGAVIAEPEFYQRAAAYGGAYSVGGTDNNMLDRITTVIEEYMKRNYPQAVGGPTGLESAEAEKKKK